MKMKNYTQIIDLFDTQCNTEYVDDDDIVNIKYYSGSRSVKLLKWPKI